jgi:hypothetical protein
MSTNDTLSYDVFVSEPIPRCATALPEPPLGRDHLVDRRQRPLRIA